MAGVGLLSFHEILRPSRSVVHQASQVPNEEGLSPVPRGSEGAAAHFVGKVGVVTGASSGIGRAVTLALARVGAMVHAVGRDRGRLAELSSGAPAGRIVAEPADLVVAAQRDALVERVSRRGALDFLIHCAGAIGVGTLAEAHKMDLDEMLAINLVAPYALTQALLDVLVAAPGDVVFVNSSVTRFPRAYSGQYAITKHGLVGFADALREEVNDRGVRVLSVFPGRTATPLTRRLIGAAGATYAPESLLQPESVAETIVAALSLPRTAEVTEVHLRPALKSS